MGEIPMKLRAVCGESSMHGSAGEGSSGNTSLDSNYPLAKKLACISEAKSRFF